MDIAIGLALVALAVALVYLGLPDKQGNSPPHLRFGTAPVLYPPMILVLFALGMAELFFRG